MVGTAVEVRGIASVDDKDLGDGKEGLVTKRIKSEYKNIYTGINTKYNYLLTNVD